MMPDNRASAAFNSESATGKRSRRGVKCSDVQDGSLADLLEQLQKDQAHLPVHDVLSIFFQVLPRCTTAMPYY